MTESEEVGGRETRWNATRLRPGDIVERAADRDYIILVIKNDAETEGSCDDNLNHGSRNL